MICTILWQSATSSIKILKIGLTHKSAYAATVLFETGCCKFGVTTEEYYDVSGIIK